MFDDDNVMLITDGTLNKLQQLISLKQARGVLQLGPVELVSGLIHLELQKELKLKETK